MNNKKIGILTFICIILAVVFLCFYYFNLNIVSNYDNYILIKKSDLPKINYAPIIYPSEEYKPFTKEEKNLLYKDAIEPFVSRMNDVGYNVISVQMGYPWDEPIILNSVLYNQERDFFISYDAAIVKDDKTDKYFYSPDSPPGYAG